MKWKLVHSNSKSTDTSVDVFNQKLETALNKKKTIEACCYWSNSGTFNESVNIVRIDGRFEDRNQRPFPVKLYEYDKLPWHLTD